MKTNGLIGKKPKDARAAWRSKKVYWALKWEYAGADGIIRWHRAASWRKA